MSNKEIYQKEQDDILENLVFNYIYPKISSDERNDQAIHLELFITSACNKNCSYCYLQKNADKLYPKDIRSPELIIKNLNIFLNHLLEHMNTIGQLDIFTGEIWESNLGTQILNTLLKYVRDGLEIKLLLIPSNASFIENEKALYNIEYFIEEFKKYKCRLVFSLSVDGLYIEEQNRPYKLSNRKNLENFYDKLFAFSDKYDYCFHPMVDASTIDLWIDNLNWWKDKTDKNFQNIISYVMMLEVRNPNSWTDEKIYKYLKFLKYYIELIIKDKRYYNNDSSKFLFNALMMYVNVENGGMFENCSYVPFLIRPMYKISCSATQHICVRLGDLALCPCHRLAYDKLLYAKYRVENDKIIGLESINNALAINHWFNGTASYLKCDICSIREICIKGCHGAQFENSKEVYYPIESVCNLQFAKNIFLITNYLEMYKQLKNNLNDSQQKKCKSIIKSFENILQAIETENKEIYNKWIQIMPNLKLNY